MLNVTNDRQTGREQRDEMRWESIDQWKCFTATSKFQLLLLTVDVYLFIYVIVVEERINEKWKLCVFGLWICVLRVIATTKATTTTKTAKTNCCRRDRPLTPTIHFHFLFTIGSHTLNERSKCIVFIEWTGCRHTYFTFIKGNSKINDKRLQAFKQCIDWRLIVCECARVMVVNGRFLWY